MTGIARFRAAVFERVKAEFGDAHNVYGSLPDDIAGVPCIVIGRPSADEGTTPTVFDAELDVFVVGNRLDIAGVDRDLDELTDAVVAALGGTRTLTLVDPGNPGGWVMISVIGIEANIVPVAGLDHPAYSVAVEHSYRTDCSSNSS